MPATATPRLCGGVQITCRTSSGSTLTILLSRTALSRVASLASASSRSAAGLLCTWASVSSTARTRSVSGSFALSAFFCCAGDRTMGASSPATCTMRPRTRSCSASARRTSSSAGMSLCRVRASLRANGLAPSRQPSALAAGRSLSRTCVCSPRTAATAAGVAAATRLACGAALMRSGISFSRRYTRPSSCCTATRADGARVSPTTRLSTACLHRAGTASTRAARLSARVSSGAKSRRIRSSRPPPIRYE